MRVRDLVPWLLREFPELKIEDVSPIVPAMPLAPLLQRLILPVMPNDLCLGDKATFVLDVIQQNIAEGKLPNKKMISQRVLGKISRYYGADLHDYDLFRKIPETRMLKFKKAAVTRYVFGCSHFGA